MTLTKSAQSALLTVLSMVGAGLANYYSQPTAVRLLSIVVAAVFGLLHIHSPATNPPASTGTGTPTSSSTGTGAAA